MASNLDQSQRKITIQALEKLESTSVMWNEVVQNKRRFKRSHFKPLKANPLRCFNEWREDQKTIKVSEGKHHFSSASLRLLLTEPALHSYLKDHGTLPQKLETLVPQYLRSTPQDPFAKQSLGCRNQGTNWLLYSMGSDLKDALGNLQRKPCPDSV